MTLTSDVIATCHVSVSSSNCCHDGFLQLIPPLADLNSVHNFDLKVLKSIVTQTGCEVEQGLKGLYTILHIQGAIGDQTESA